MAESIARNIVPIYAPQAGLASRSSAEPLISLTPRRSSRDRTYWREDGGRIWTASASAPTIIESGAGYRYASASAQYHLSGAGISLGVGWTALIVCRHASVGTYQRYLDLRSSGGSNDGMSIALWTTGGPAIQYNGGSLSLRGATVTAGAVEAFAVSHDGSSTRWYTINGLSQTTAFVAGSVGTPTVPAIGSLIGGGGQYMNGEIYALELTREILLEQDIVRRLRKLRSYAP